MLAPLSNPGQPIAGRTCGGLVRLVDPNAALAAIEQLNSAPPLPGSTAPLLVLIRIMLQPFQEPSFHVVPIKKTAYPPLMGDSDRSGTFFVEMERECTDPGHPEFDGRYRSAQGLGLKRVISSLIACNTEGSSTRGWRSGILGITTSKIHSSQLVNLQLYFGAKSSGYCAPSQFGLIWSGECCAGAICRHSRGQAPESSQQG